MLSTFLQDLFMYHDEANRRYIHVLNETDFENEDAERLFSHLLNAHHIWVSRIYGEGPKYGIWEIQKKDFYQTLHDQNQDLTFKILEELALDLDIYYKNSRGESFNNSVRDILLHIVNHATYHRGQIARLLRADDVDPPNSDYIFYKRQAI